MVSNCWNESSPSRCESNGSHVRSCLLLLTNPDGRKGPPLLPLQSRPGGRRAAEAPSSGKLYAMFDNNVFVFEASVKNDLRLLTAVAKCRGMWYA